MKRKKLSSCAIIILDIASGSVFAKGAKSQIYERGGADADGVCCCPSVVCFAAAGRPADRVCKVGKA